VVWRFVHVCLAICPLYVCSLFTHVCYSSVPLLFFSNSTPLSMVVIGLAVAAAVGVVFGGGYCYKTTKDEREKAAQLELQQKEGNSVL